MLKTEEELLNITNFGQKSLEEVTAKLDELGSLAGGISRYGFEGLMPTPKRGPRFGGDAAHQKSMMSNLAQELFWDDKVTTTVAKAKMLRPYAEKMITRARKGTLHARRVILADIGDTEVVTRLFDEVAPPVPRAGRWLHQDRSARAAARRWRRDGHRRARLIRP